VASELYGFSAADYPMRPSAEAHLILDLLQKEFGVYHTIIPYNAPDLVDAEFKFKGLCAGSQINPVESYTHNQI
jgi:hypothetical protein